jgi:alkylated DNA repair dioxygenase AlkB
MAANLTSNIPFMADFPKGIADISRARGTSPDAETLGPQIYTEPRRVRTACRCYGARCADNVSATSHARRRGLRMAGRTGQGWHRHPRHLETVLRRPYIGIVSQNAVFPIVADTLVRGFVYEPDFLSQAQEAALIDKIQRLPLQEAEYKQFRAKRRIKSYGGRYDFGKNQLFEAEPIAQFLHPLRERVALWAGHASDHFTQVLIAEYVAGTQLGWHRDVPDFECVVGISLGTACRMRFRRYPPTLREPSIVAELAPRSIYRLEGEARWEWQHRIPPTPGLRYSITLRTLRKTAHMGCG